MRVPSQARPTSARRPATCRSAGAAGTLSANLVSGDLPSSEAAAGLAVTTVSGDVQVRAAGGGRCGFSRSRATSSSAIKPGERLYIDASSVSGTMSSELDLDDAPPGGPGHAVSELRVRTVSGDLKIVRAARSRV